MTVKKTTKVSFPDVWGEGSLFAFSGLDGKSNWYDPYVGTLLEDRIGFTIHTEREKTCWIAVRSGEKTYYAILASHGRKFTACRPEIVGGDIISLELRGGHTVLQLLSMPLSSDSFLLRFYAEKVVPHAVVYFIMRIDACKIIVQKRDHFIVKTDLDTIFVTSSKKPYRFFVVDSMEEVTAAILDRADLRAQYWDGDREVRYLVLGMEPKKQRPFSILVSVRERKKVPRNMDAIVAKRKSFYLTRIKRSGQETLAKALSILKANVESPQGVFKQRWTTPDRFPHRHLWLWDSCFHALGYATIDKRLGEDTLASVLDTQQTNGFVPHIGKPNGNFSSITQPPLLAWAALSVYRITGNRPFLQKCFPRIRQYLEWCAKQRDENRNGLLEWKRSDESGMDNSSRFNHGCQFDAIDFSSIYANDLQCLYRISEEIGKTDASIIKKAEKVNDRIRHLLWNAKRQFFCDRYPSGQFSPYKTVCGFLPLFSGSATKKQAAALVEHLTDERSFYTALPVPSEPIDSPTFDNNMWRGPVWLNYNYFVIEGLRRYGYHDLAAHIRERTIREVERWYRREGTIFEFYDPFARLSPRQIPRKDTYGAIKEFGWSASLYLVLKCEKDGVQRQKKALTRNQIQRIKP
jgi:hypothetical protein